MRVGVGEGTGVWLAVGEGTGVEVAVGALVGSGAAAGCSGLQPARNSASPVVPAHFKTGAG